MLNAQAELAASNSALAAARTEVSRLQRELSARAREASESALQLEGRAREVSERRQEIVQLQAAVAELRQQVAAHEQQKAAAAPRCMLDMTPSWSSTVSRSECYGQSIGDVQQSLACPNPAAILPVPVKSELSIYVISDVHPACAAW